MANEKGLAFWQRAFVTWNKWKVEWKEANAFREEWRTREEHVAFLRQSVMAWNEWRVKNPEMQPDLSWGDLSGANLSEANLSGCNLLGTNLSGANLSGANLSEASIWLTRFADLDLSTVIGLDTVRHVGPSTIGIDSLYRSYQSGGKIPEIFLRGCGVPDSLIENLPLLIGAMQPIQFYSCFISYSTKDEDFATHLHDRMQQKGLRVWYALKNLKPGTLEDDEIDRAIHSYDKLVLIISEQSLRSKAIMNQLRKARKAELDSNQRKLFPIRLVDKAAMEDWEYFDPETGQDLAAEVRKYVIPDFAHWKDHETFEREFAKLLDALKAQEVLPVERIVEAQKLSSTQDAEGSLSKQAQQHLREVIEGKTRRLRHLEKREAVQGVATDPKDRIEIEDLRREIGQLEAEL